jgi:hypothetical protein
VSTESGAESGAPESERRASGEPAERNAVRPAFIIYTAYIYYIVMY